MISRYSDAGILIIYNANRYSPSKVYLLPLQEFYEGIQDLRQSAMLKRQVKNIFKIDLM